MKNLKKRIKEMKAITLISLVITIIILIILASITISLTLGNNGILNRAKYARDEYLNIVDKEEKAINDLYGQLQVATSGQVTVDYERLEKIILDKTYPVGSIYITIDSKNPSETLGGTWESYGQGRTLMGAGTGTDTNSESKTFEVNATGGEYNHTLTVAEMPSHNHAISIGSGTTKIGTGANFSFFTNWSSNITYSSLSFNSNDKGGSKAHNNIQPYIVTYMWKRIS